MSDASPSPVLSVNDLAVSFHTRNGVVRAVDGVSFEVHPGETLGIVGESGCGKSVTSFALLQLIPQPPGRIERGTARFQGETDLLQASEAEMRRIRGRQIAMIFQDPMTSLNPFLKVGTQLIEPLTYHLGMKRKAALARGEAALEAVGMPDPARRLQSYPHELSGGQRQRVMIAMALMLEPSLLIADEPTTALDVSVQAQILDLLAERAQKRNVGVILITHDLAVVAERCDRVLVMYAGMVMESGPVQEVFAEPRHPYTQALMRALPSQARQGQRLFALDGGPPDLSQPIPGDPLALRPGVINGGKWDHARPPLEAVSPTHWVRQSDVTLPAEVPHG